MTKRVDAQSGRECSLGPADSALVVQRSYRGGTEVVQVGLLRSLYGRRILARSKKANNTGGQDVSVGMSVMEMEGRHWGLCMGEE